MGRFVWGDVGENKTLLLIPENEPMSGIMQNIWVEGNLLKTLTTQVNTSTTNLSG